MCDPPKLIRLYIYIFSGCNFGNMHIRLFQTIIQSFESMTKYVACQSLEYYANTTSSKYASNNESRDQKHTAKVSAKLVSTVHVSVNRLHAALRQSILYKNQLKNKSIINHLSIFQMEFSLIKEKPCIVFQNCANLSTWQMDRT